jgi:hypothetical protein
MSDEMLAASALESRLGFETLISDTSAQLIGATSDTISAVVEAALERCGCS